MMSRISIIALAVLATLLSGCGCSKEKKPVEGQKNRMEDAAYTNTLVKLHKDQASATKKISVIKQKIEKLGKDAATSPEYISLTNDLAKAKAESEMIRKTTQMAVRNRLMEDAAKKGNLK